MNSYLVDINVWLALLVQQHAHHTPSLDWFSARGPGEVGLCRIAQLGVVRLMGNARVMQGAPVRAARAWGAVRESLDDERVEFLDEPAGIDAIVPTLFQYPVPTPQLINDAYLAAFAMASRRRLATYDRGFRQFRGLDVEFLGD